MFHTTHEHYPYSIRQAKIVGVISHEPSDEPLIWDIGPQRNDIVLQGVNCTLEEFYDWFFKTKTSDDFVQATDKIIEIGGSRLDLSVGSLLTVSFKDVLNAQIDAGGRLR